MDRDHRETEKIELELLLTGMAQRYGYDFRNYARASLMRRIHLAMQREGLPNISALQAKVMHDAACMLRLVETISVHTTAMFRDAEFYLTLRREVIPLLRTYPFIRIWHVGCSTGEEVYSLAIVLEEEGLYERCRLYATDISDGALERARKGVYRLSGLREHTGAYLRAGGQRDFSSYYVTDHENAVLRQSLRRNVVFSQHNLASDGPFNEFQLILCRNVTIYFDNVLRARAHSLFFGTLIKFGILGLGIKESLASTPFEAHYQELPGGHRLYRKVQS